MISNPYITNDQFQQILEPLNINMERNVDQQDLVDRASGALEAELVERFVVPLTAGAGGAFNKAPAYAQNIVLTAMKAMIRSLIGIDKNRNVIVDQGQRYIDLHQGEFNKIMKALLDPKREFGFALQPQAVGGLEPIQQVGLARPNNRMRRVVDPDAI